LATTHVPRNANSATTTAEGTVAVSPATPRVTMSGPKAASTSTESHITMIVSEAHISGTRSRVDQDASSAIREGSCGTVVI
jgi:hypothetical protein